MNKIFGCVTPEVRNWIYGVGMALIPLLITLGVLTDDIAKDIALILAAVLGFTSNAIAKTNVTKPTALADLDAKG